MKALITGAPGFVGNHLARLLITQGYEVWGTAFNEKEKMDADLADKVRVEICDIRNQQQIKAILDTCCPDYVFHLAAQSNVARSWEEPAETMEINVLGTIKLLEEIIKYNGKCKVLLIGSAEEYGKLQPEQMPISELLNLNPVTPYGTSKAAVSMLFKQYQIKYDLQVVMARSFNHIGMGQAPGFVVPDFAKQIAEIEAGLREPVLSVGNLDAARDFTDVKDVVRAYASLIERGQPGEVYNVASGRPVRIEEVLNILLSKAKVNISVIRDPLKMRPSDVPIMYGDIAKIKAATGWTPIISIDQSLDDILQFWRSKISI